MCASQNREWRLRTLGDLMCARVIRGGADARSGERPAGSAPTRSRLPAIERCTRPFWSLDALRRGDRIVLSWRGLRHVYVVTGSRVVAPTYWSIARERGYEGLILTTCTPRFSARERLVVFAAAVATTPRPD
jgi:LPXTG-site transpeptidase (sortase) family protein